MAAVPVNILIPVEPVPSITNSSAAAFADTTVLSAVFTCRAAKGVVSPIPTLPSVVTTIREVSSPPTALFLAKLAIYVSSVFQELVTSNPLIPAPFCVLRRPKL